MKAAAAVYTLASVAVLGLMIYTRTPVESTAPTPAAPAQEATGQQPANTGQPLAAPAETPASPAPDTSVAPAVPAQQTQVPAEAQTPAITDTPAPAQNTGVTPTQEPPAPEAQAPAAAPLSPPAQTQTPSATPEAQAPATAPLPPPTQTQTAPTPPEVQAPVTPPAQTTPPTEQSTPDEKKNDVISAAKPAANAIPDYAREQRLDYEIRDMILDGEVIALNDGTQNFMGILTEAEQPRGAAIILPGRGYHPDWQDVAHPLRTGLAEKGWTTLSLQMPVLEKEAKYYDYVPLFPNADKRIDAGIAFLKQKGISPIVLIGHSCGAHMAMHWVENRGDSDIAAYVGLGMGATDYQQAMVSPFPLDKMKVPVLDVYGEKEYPQVINTATERQTLMQKAGNSQSKQMVLPEADHYFHDKGAELNAVVANWLNSLQM